MYSKLPRYKNPPINEVVVGLSFSPLVKMKVAHIGLFWNTIKSEFPKCQQAPILGADLQNIDEIIEPETGAPIPRTWFINNTDDHLIQLQKNRFLFNWRKREQTYPHFEEISKRFFLYLKEFEEFSEGNDIGTIEYKNYELTYINNILMIEQWDKINAVRNLFPDISWNNEEKHYLRNPETINWQSVFTLQDGKIKLITKIQSGFRRIDNHPLYIFEITARSNENGASIKKEEWYELAHESIVLAFEDLTAENIQKNVWKKTEG